MGSINKLIKSGIKDSNIEGDALKDGVATTAKFGPNSVESSEINNGTVAADDLVSTLDVSSKTVTLANTSVTAAQLSNTLDLSSKTVTLASDVVNFDREYNNIALLGFKMATQESLTVFNLVDGVVDEFNDESGTDEAEGSNDLYCATSDFYDNVSSGCISAGFSMTAITEPDTSTAGTNPTQGSGSFGTFTVPTGLTSLEMKVWGAGSGGGNYDPNTAGGTGGGGGYSEGILAVTGSQVLHVSAGEGGGWSTGGLGGFKGGGNPTPQPSPNSGGTGGGGLAGVFTAASPSVSSAPQAYLVAGSGGGGGYKGGSPGIGGAGGGTNGCAGGSTTEQSTALTNAGGGGSQTAGGQGANGNPGASGSLFTGGTTSGPGGGCNAGAGGAGYYGGGGGQVHPSFPYSNGATGGGGSSFFGHPQITSGSTEEGSTTSGGGTGQPGYVAATNEGNTSYSSFGEDGYVLLTGSFNVALATTIVSEPFASGTVPTTSRIVVFEENVDTPTLNTDIIASISRDGGVTFTAATLADSGYVTGSSGQRILTGQATISGQPSGQSMRWKLALANNQVKIHGVSLSWA